MTVDRLRCELLARVETQVRVRVLAVCIQPDAGSDSIADGLADRHTHHVDSDRLSDRHTHHVDSYALADRHTHHADSDADAHANTFAHTDRRTLANAVLHADRDADDETAYHRRALVLSFAHADGGALALAHNDAYECSVVAADGPADVVAHAEV
jgi:hypothetical protein